MPKTVRTLPWSSVVYGPQSASFGDRGRPEVGVVEDRPLVAGRDERRRQVGLPDPLGEPGAARAVAEQSLQLVGHPDELADPVALRQGREDRLVPAAADDLDLAAPDEAGQPVEELGPLGPQPGQQGTGVVEREADRTGGARAPRASAGRPGRRSRR